MLRKPASGVIHDVRMNGAIGVPVRDDMCVMLAGRVMEREADIVVARAAGRCFRRRYEQPLQRQSERCHHRDDDDHPPRQWTPCTAQRRLPDDIFNYTVAAKRDK